jgi:hypothetical protein
VGSWRRPRRFILALALVLLPAPAAASTILDYVTLDGIDYIRWADEPGRTLGQADLGPEFAVIGCSFGEDSRSCPFGVDAAAAFMPAGSRMYAVRGYTTDFRLAAVWKDRIFLYQAWRNPRAKVGRDLFDLAGKVRAVDVQRGGPLPPSPRAPASITSDGDAAALVDMVLRSPTRSPVAHSPAEPRYWLTFWLADGTTLSRPYFAETGELMGGVFVSAGFRPILERYLTD